MFLGNDAECADLSGAPESELTGLSRAGVDSVGVGSGGSKWVC